MLQAPAVTTPPTGDYLYKNNLTLSGTSYSSPVSVSAANFQMSSRWNGTINFGILPGDIHIREVEDLFYKYGSNVDIDLKIPPRPPYAFVKFVNFTEIMKRDSPQSATETAFALAALMEIPLLL